MLFPGMYIQGHSYQTAWYGLISGVIPCIYYHSVLESYFCSYNALRALTQCSIVRVINHRVINHRVTNHNLVNKK